MDKKKIRDFFTKDISFSASISNILPCLHICNLIFCVGLGLPSISNLSLMARLFTPTRVNIDKNSLNLTIAFNKIESRDRHAGRDLLRSGTQSISRNLSMSAGSRKTSASDSFFFGSRKFGRNICVVWISP